MATTIAGTITTATIVAGTTVTTITDTGIAEHRETPINRSRTWAGASQHQRMRMATILMLIASSFLLVLSNIFVSKAVKRDYDMIYLCLAGISGFVSMIVPVTWYIWH